jgi:ribosomal protein S18 acetylase RimI-like enzyme
MSVTMRRATPNDLDAVVRLFDGYRQFYGKASDPSLARQFLAERLAQHDSIVLIAERSDGTAVGFVQLYPSFSSVRAARIYILNDLYVVPEARGRGTGSLLLRGAADVARASGAVRMKLSTAVTNVAAQKLYETEGWKRDEDFYEYGLSL